VALPWESPASGGDGLLTVTSTHSEARSASARDALARLRRCTSNAQLAERIPIELCEAGFARVLLSRIEHNTWIVCSAHMTHDAGMAEALLQAGRAHPRRLCAPLPESAMVRLKKPILVEHPQTDARVHTDLVDVVKPDVYVAAPIYMWQRPVGLLHADAPSSAGDVSVADRDLLGVFAEALGTILERNAAMEQMQAMRDSAQTYARTIRSLTVLSNDDTQPELGPERSRMDSTVSIADFAPRGTTDDQITRREQEVLHLMAAGGTNAQIAERLFVSEGTVKTHVRHIMQKLDASNRTDAVARYQHRVAPRVRGAGSVVQHPTAARIPPMPHEH
jgi:DNA-binding CsgD family transcriptional regulator